MVRNTPASTSDYVRLVNLRGAVASWSSETGTRNASATPSLREVRPTHGELYSYPAFTRWLAEDSQFNVSQFVTENVSDEFAKSLENAILLGDGSNKPTGILDTAPVSTSDGASPERDADTIEFVSGTADLADDIISLYFSLKPEYRARAQFLMSSSTLAAVRKLRDSDGSGFLWQVNLSAGIDAPDGLLLAKPVAISEYMGTAAASPLEDPILCGDFDAGYELVRIGGMVLVRDDVTTPGKIKLYIAQRFGGRLTDNDAIKALRA
jgi:HK97 family phage major capsid protein